MKRLTFFLCLLFVGCRHEMYNQPRDNPLTKSDFFSDGAASRPLIAGTIARGQLEEDDAYFRGKNGTNLAGKFPVPVDLALLQRGRERYDIYCSVCHGRTGDGNGMVAQRGFPPPPSYHIDRLRQVPPGYFFDVITRGYGVMYSYAARVEPGDRWAIAAYIRALQLSHDARLEDVPTNDRVKLEARNP